LGCLMHTVVDGLSEIIVVYEQIRALSELEQRQPPMAQTSLILLPMGAKRFNGYTTAI
jgi:hypothetical protein